MSQTYEELDIFVLVWLIKWNLDIVLVSTEMHAGTFVLVFSSINGAVDVWKLNIFREKRIPQWTES